MRIAFLCIEGLESFVKPIVNHFNLFTQHDVKLVFPKNKEDVESAYAWADVTWFEWCNELPVQAIEQTQPYNHRVVIRLHSYEAFRGFPAAIKRWDCVDDLIFVAPHIQKFVNEQTPAIAAANTRQHVVKNGVDLGRFKLAPHKDNHRVGYLGYINHKKGPELMLQAFERIASQIDKPWSFHIAGKFQEPVYMPYFNQFLTDSLLLRSTGPTPNIKFHGWVDSIAWLPSVDYILSSSIIEACPVGILEAMATGRCPLIHRFFGAGEVFPEEFLWTNLDDLVTLIERKQEPERYRSYIEENHDQQRQFDELEKILTVQ